MGNLLGNLFVTLKLGMYYRVQPIWDRSWGICLAVWKGSIRAPTDPVGLSPVVCGRDLQEEPCPGDTRVIAVISPTPGRTQSASTRGSVLACLRMSVSNRPMGIAKASSMP